MDVQYRVRNYRSGSKRDQFRKRFGKLLEDFESFKNAVVGLHHHSINNYADRLPDFFLYLNEDPDTVIKNRQTHFLGKDLIKASHYDRKVKEYLKIQKDKNLALHSIICPIQGFFSNNNYLLQLHLGQFKISRIRKNLKYSPSQEEVNTLFNNTKNLVNKIIIALAYQNGLLPQDIACLKIGDYPTEPWISYRKLRKKSGSAWYGVSTPEICELVNKYLTIRKGNPGEQLLLNRHKKPISAVCVRQRIKKIIKKVGYNTIPQFTPKCLRDGFADVLLDLNLYFLTEEAMMGHAVGSNPQYGSESKLMERTVCIMRKIYPNIKLTQKPIPPKKRIYRYNKAYSKMANKRYYDANREQILAHKKEYNRAYREERRAYNRKRYQNNREKIKHESSIYRKTHREEINKYKRKRYWTQKSEKQKTPKT